VALLGLPGTLLERPLEPLEVGALGALEVGALEPEMGMLVEYRRRRCWLLRSRPPGEQTEAGKLNPHSRLL
jgi:hypothetical protein